MGRLLMPAYFLTEEMNKNWTLLDGFLTGAGIIVAGLMLQVAAGPVLWDVFAWPANGIVLAAFLAIIVLIYLLGKKFDALRFIGSYKAAVPAMIYAVILTVIMGLTKQTVSGNWFSNMLAFWPFVLIYVYIALILGIIIIRHALHFSWKRDIPFMLNHLGLFIALVAGTLGNADMQRVKMITAVDQPEWRVMTNNGDIKELDIAIELKKFIMETYDDGSPKRFASDINIFTKSGKSFATTVDVNKPAEVEGWKIYQYGYDTQMGAMSNTSILELVHDPWLPLVYAGIFMMIAGALSLFFIGAGRRKKS